MNAYSRRFARIAVCALFTCLILVPVSDAQVRATPQRANPRIANVQPRPVGATDMFIKIDGIEGEATAADGHKGWIALDTGTWSTQDSSARRQTPAGTGPGTLTIVRTVDRTSPKLTEACNDGRSLGRAIVHVRSTRGTGYDEYVIDEATLRSCSQDSDGDRPTETITLTFDKIESSPSRSGAVIGSRSRTGDPDRPVVTGR